MIRVTFPPRTTFWLALGIWMIFLVSAVTLGAVRDAMVAPRLGEQAAHIIGTVLFIATMLAIMLVFFNRTCSGLRHSDLWGIGMIWTVLTVGFEFGFFHFVVGVPWRRLLADYNIFAGRLWVLVLLTTLLGPPLLGRWCQVRNPRQQAE